MGNTISAARRPCNAPDVIFSMETSETGNGASREDEHAIGCRLFVTISEASHVVEPVAEGVALR